MDRQLGVVSSGRLRVRTEIANEVAAVVVVVVVLVTMVVQIRFREVSCLRFSP